MRRRILAILAAASLMAVSVSPAWGDAGAPGTTFPEQPGGHVRNACVAITTNPGTSLGGVFDAHASDLANDLTSALLRDACLPG
jgi:hypothetical protein